MSRWLTRERHARRWIVPLASFALLLTLLTAPRSSHASQGSRSDRRTEARGPAPNIVLILTDDQRWDSLWAMKNVQSDLVGKGITFNNAFVVNSLCCPSRSTILTGKYSHTTLVYDNGGTYGGFKAFHDDHNTIAVWLHNASYYTGLVGKYLNQYQTTYIPPGWDRWNALLMNSEDGGYYYNYTLNIDGTLVPYGSSEADYSTDVFASQADSFIRTAPTDKPLFLYFAPFAPHYPSTPAPKYQKAFGGLPPARPPNYNEADVSDKPAWVQHIPLMSSQAQAAEDRLRKDAYRTLLSVDDAVHTIVTALSDTARLSNTLIVFASDNGLAYGEHRWKGKKNAYEESIRVPLVVRYDPIINSPSTDDHLVANVDLAQTFASAAGVPAPGAEGLDMMPLLTDPNTPWRHDLLIEHRQKPHNREDVIPTFCAVRDDALQPEGYLYVSYLHTGEEELYDLKNDFYELQNVATDPSYASQLDYLRSQEALLCNPPPPP